MHTGNLQAANKVVVSAHPDAQNQRAQLVELLQKIRACLRDFNATDEEVACLRGLRLELAGLYLTAPLDAITEVHGGRLVEAHNWFYAGYYGSAINLLPQEPAESELLNSAAKVLIERPDTDEAMRALLVCEILAPAYKTGMAATAEHYRGKFGLRFLRYWLRYCSIFFTQEDADAHYVFSAREWTNFADCLPGLESSQQKLLLNDIPEMINIAGIYTLDHEALDLMKAFGRVRQAYMQILQEVEPWTPSVVKNKKKPKIGILVMGVLRMHEHYMLLAHLRAMQELDAEIIVFSANPVESRFAGYFSYLTDDHVPIKNRFLGIISPYWSRLVILKGHGLKESVELIRKENLDLMLLADVILFGEKCSMLSSTRLARRQATLACWSVASASMPDTIDTMITSEYTEPPGRDPKTAYGEPNVYVFPGPMQVFDYAGDLVRSQGQFNRKSLDVDKSQVLYASTSAMLKYSTDVIEAWCEILRQVPNSSLAILPYSPNWHLHSSNLSDYILIQRFMKAAKDSDMIKRIRVLRPMHRNDIINLMTTVDVYLDAFPFTGNMAITEPLLGGVPIVAKRCNTQRGCQAVSHLLAVGAEDGIAETVEDYVSIAVKFGRDAKARGKVRRQIRKALKTGSNHAFDVEGFAQRFNPVIRQILSE